MKKIIIVFISLFVILLISCSEKRVENTTPPKDSILGKIVIVGNAPFSKLALQINDSTIYILECTNAVKDSLINNQGELYKIYFSKILETEMDTKIIVTRAEQN